MTKLPDPEAVLINANEAVPAVLELIVGFTFRTVLVPVPVDVPVIAITPEVVIGPPETDSQAGTVTSTEET